MDKIKHRMNVSRRKHFNGMFFFELLTNAGLVCVKLPKKTFISNGSCTEVSDENNSKSQFACKVGLHEFNSSLDIAIKKSVDSGEQFVSSIRDYLLAKAERSFAIR